MHPRCTHLELPVHLHAATIFSRDDSSSRHTQHLYVSIVAEDPLAQYACLSTTHSAKQLRVCWFLNLFQDENNALRFALILVASITGNPIQDHRPLTDGPLPLHTTPMEADRTHDRTHDAHQPTAPYTHTSRTSCLSDLKHTPVPTQPIRSGLFPPPPVSSL